MELHDGNIFFKHKHPTIDIEYMIKRIDSFEAFERMFSDDLMDS